MYPLWTIKTVGALSCVTEYDDLAAGTVISRDFGWLSAVVYLIGMPKTAEIQAMSQSRNKLWGRSLTTIW
jgi:hypothetical protein